MVINLKCNNSVQLSPGLIGEPYVFNEGDVVSARITDAGVNLLVDGVWSLEYYVRTIDKYFSPTAEEASE